MGATITTGKAAAAFRALDGNVYYALFEETYEKNCHPHNPSWSCVLMGTIEQALRWIFLAASSCEGGMLQGRGGNITSVGYIDGWLKEMANPTELSDRIIHLAVGSNFNAPIPKEKAECALKMLADQGFKQEAENLSAGQTISVSLYEKPLLVSALYGGTLGAWRILAALTRMEGRCNPDLGYKPASCKPLAVAVPGFYRVDSENRLVQQPDGMWRCEGWEYSIVASYVAKLWEVQLREPGSYRKRTNAFREAIANAPMVPAGTRIEVDITVPLESSYQRSDVERVQKEVSCTMTENGYVLNVPTDGRKLYSVCRLPVECTRWVIPVADALSLSGETPCQQLALID